MYDWEREVADKDGDTMLFALRGPLVAVDVAQENGLLWFTVAGFAGFLEAAHEAFMAASRAAARAEAAGAGELG